MKKYLVPITIAVAVVILGAGAFYLLSQQKGTVLSAQEASDKALEFINNNLLQEGATAEFVSVTEESGLYKIKVKVGESQPDVYLSKDGKYLFIQPPIDIATSSEATSSQENQGTSEVPKSDKPDVKLFVMSYCPYGLQAEKMYLPVYELLKNNADMGIYFVDYIMHEKKEIDENLRQYCIQKDQNAKYPAYLSCFVKAGDFAGCLTQAGVNTASMNSCITATDNQYGITAGYNDKSTWLNGTYPQFNISEDLNDQYGVGGSPTVVINGVQASPSTRSPEAFKQLICQAFNNPPAECSQTLSTAAASVSFGEGTGSGTAGSCQ